MSKIENESESFNIIFKSPLLMGLDSTQIMVQNSIFHNRKSTNNILEATIDSEWKSKIEENPHLFNGTKFRYAGHTWDNDLKQVHMKLGITDYASVIGTNMSACASRLQERGLKEHNDPQIHLGNALGVGSVVETTDQKLVFIERSHHVGEAQGMIDVPGGHPEPKNLVGSIKKEAIDIDSLSPISIRDEIFTSILSEIEDEINIPLDKLHKPRLLGLVGNKTTANRPTAEFHVICNCSSDEVTSMYGIGSQKEKFETTRILFISKDSVKDIHKDPMYSKFTPSAKGSIYLYNTLCI